MSEIKITTICPNCGGQLFEVPRLNLRPKDQLTCPACGFSDNIQNIAILQLKKELPTILRDIGKSL